MSKEGRESTVSYNQCECVRVEKIDDKLYGIYTHYKKDSTYQWVRKKCLKLDNERCENKWKIK